MKRFGKVGIVLRDVPSDEAVLAFAAHIAEAGAHSFYCILVNEPRQIQTDDRPDRAAFQDRVMKALPAEMSDRVTCEIREGDPLEQTLRVARDQELDLAIIGRKLPSSQAGLGGKIVRIVRKCPCSVLIVPELCQPHFDRVLVAVDCSDHSRNAMETAVALAKAAGKSKPQLLALTVRRVAARYDLAGVTFKQSCQAQRDHGKADLDKFLSGIDRQGLPVEQLVVLSDLPALAISHVATAKKMDIVVAGSRGATGTAAALLGSTSEKLLMACALPIMMVKKKGETLHLLEALFSLD